MLTRHAQWVYRHRKRIGIAAIVVVIVAGAFGANVQKKMVTTSNAFELLFVLGFALTTDYGVFLLTRIKEAHDEGRPNPEAVAYGLERTGRT